MIFALMVATAFAGVANGLSLSLVLLACIGEVAVFFPSRAR